MSEHPQHVASVMGYPVHPDREPPERARLYARLEAHGGIPAHPHAAEAVCWDCGTAVWLGPVSARVWAQRPELRVLCAYDAARHLAQHGGSAMALTDAAGREHEWGRGPTRRWERHDQRDGGPGEGPGDGRR